MGTIAILSCNFGPPEVMGQSAELTESDFAQGAIMMGRNPNVAIPIPDDEISRIQCSLNYNNEGFFLTDESSTNGTRINGEKLEPTRAYKLRHGDEIQMGHTSFIFNIAQPEFYKTTKQEIARQLLQNYDWKVAANKGFRHWIVPTPQDLEIADPVSKDIIRQAFDCSAHIGFDLEPYAGKRALMEKYQIAKEGGPSYEAYILFLNGRVIGAYAADPANDARLIALDESVPTDTSAAHRRATRKARAEKQTAALKKISLPSLGSHLNGNVYPE